MLVPRKYMTFMSISGNLRPQTILFKLVCKPDSLESPTMYTWNLLTDMFCFVIKYTVVVSQVEFHFISFPVFSELDFVGKSFQLVRICFFFDARL